MTSISLYDQAGFADKLGLSDHFEADEDTSALSPWGIARLIRREVRRRGLVTRQELRRRIEPLLMASGCDDNTMEVIRDVASRMVDVGELVDLKIENQRGYCARPSRWIKLGDNTAVLLGVTTIEADSLMAMRPGQFLQRFSPSDSIIAQLETMDVERQSFLDWLVEPGWREVVDTRDSIETLQDLLTYHLDLLEKEGTSFSRSDTKVLVIANRPGDFFGQPWSPQNTRWTLPSQVDDGIYLGAQPGFGHRQWHPLLIQLSGESGRSFPLNSRNDPRATNDLRNWLLVALGARKRRAERINFDHTAGKVTFTFPLPSQLQRCLNLAGELCKGWTYHIGDSISLQEFLEQQFPEIEFRPTASGRRLTHE